MVETEAVASLEAKKKVIKGYIFQTMDKYLDLMNSVKGAKTESEVASAMDSFKKEVWFNWFSIFLLEE
jgi:hypothetical protein